MRYDFLRYSFYLGGRLFKQGMVFGGLKYPKLSLFQLTPITYLTLLYKTSLNPTKRTILVHHNLVL